MTYSHNFRWRTINFSRPQVCGTAGRVVSRDKRGAARPVHRPGAAGRPDRDVPPWRVAVRVAVRRTSGARGRRGLGGRPSRRPVVRAVPAVVPVLQPARPVQGLRPPSAGPRRPPPAAAVVVRQGRRRSHGVPGVLRAVRAAVHAGQGERHIRHGRVHRLRAHAQAQVHRPEQGGCARFPRRHVPRVICYRYRTSVVILSRVEGGGRAMFAALVGRPV